MVRCNLSILLAERQLKITKVSNDTGISRTTLTALCNNNSQGIQFDTIDKLCSYLKVSPGDIIAYASVPIDDYDVYITSENDHCIEFDLILTILGNRNYGDSLITGEADLGFWDNKVCDVEIFLSFRGDSNSLKQDEEYNELKNIFKNLPKPFLIDVKKRIQNKILEEIIFNLDLDIDVTVNVSMDWPFD